MVFKAGQYLIIGCIQPRFIASGSAGVVRGYGCKIYTDLAFNDIVP